MVFKYHSIDSGIAYSVNDFGWDGLSTPDTS